MENVQERILILAPNARDALATSKILQSAELQSLICMTLNEVICEMETGAGAIVLAKEALSQASTENFSAALARQPKWSSLPIILFISNDELDQLKVNRISILITYIKIVEGTESIQFGCN